MQRGLSDFFLAEAGISPVICNLQFLAIDSGDRCMLSSKIAREPWLDELVRECRNG